MGEPSKPVGQGGRDVTDGGGLLRPLDGPTGPTIGGVAGG
jgi:hypothetical protein